MNQSTKLIQKLKQGQKSDNFCYSKVGRAITKCGAIEKSPICYRNVGKMTIFRYTFKHGFKIH